MDYGDRSSVLYHTLSIREEMLILENKVERHCVLAHGISLQGKNWETVWWMILHHIELQAVS